MYTIGPLTRQIFTDLKKLTSKLSDKFVMKQLITTEMLGCAVLSCDLSLITIYNSDYRQFSDIHVSQGCVGIGTPFQFSSVHVI